MCGAKPVFYGSQDPETIMALALKVENGIHHVFQHPRPCNIALLGHVPNNKGRNIIILGNPH